MSKYQLKQVESGSILKRKPGEYYVLPIRGKEVILCCPICGEECTIDKSLLKFVDATISSKTMIRLGCCRMGVSITFDEMVRVAILKVRRDDILDLLEADL